MTLGGLLIAHGSALILPLAVVEGPVVSVAAGVLAEQGAVAWYWAVCLLVCGDLLGDIACYCLGRTGGGPLAALGRRFGLRATLSGDLRHRLTHNATRMLVIGKWTHSVGGLVLIGSGMLRVPLRRFLVVNLLATIPKTAVLFGLGYFAGQYYPLLRRHFASETAVLCAIGVAAIALVLRRAGGIRADGAGR